MCYDSLSLLYLLTKFIFEQTEMNQSEDRLTLPLALYHCVVYLLSCCHVNITGIVSIYTEFPFISMNVHIVLMNMCFTEIKRCSIFLKY